MKVVHVRAWEMLFLMLFALVAGVAFGRAYHAISTRATAPPRDDVYVKWLQDDGAHLRAAMYAYGDAYHAVCGRFLVPMASEPQANWVVEATERVAKARRATPAWNIACQTAITDYQRAMAHANREQGR